LPVLMRGFCRLLTRLYEPETYFRRSLRSLEVWETRVCQRPPSAGSLAATLRGVLNSVWVQGLRSNYRRSYWKFLWDLRRKFRDDSVKLFYGSQILLAAHHFLLFSRNVVAELERDCRQIETQTAQPLSSSLKPGEVMEEPQFSR
jgi:hypothetical protein